ncbi:MAG: TetR/AcrR family transcriptional regulator [Bacteroidales bacterium]|nr:TetR/AcrR family transcriptional regulator [Bacteroidales bacterium]
MDLKQRILQESSQLLFSIGPAAMTMDMVAHSCGISKRTLYEQFPDKKSLIKECLIADHAEDEEEFRAIFETADNCFDALFSVFYSVRKKLSTTIMSFPDDMKRLYPDLHCSLTKESEHKHVMGLASVLSEAQEQGLVEKSINTQVASFLFFMSTHTIHRNKQIAEYGFTKIDVLDGAFINFLRGVASAKGLELIDAYLQKNNTKQ